MALQILKLNATVEYPTVDSNLPLCSQLFWIGRWSSILACDRFKQRINSISQLALLLTKKIWNVLISKWDYRLLITVPSSLTQLSCTQQRTHAAGIATNLREFLPIFDTHFASDCRLPVKVERVSGFLYWFFELNGLSE